MIESNCQLAAINGKFRFVRGQNFTPISFEVFGPLPVGEMLFNKMLVEIDQKLTKGRIVWELKKTVQSTGNVDSPNDSEHPPLSEAEINLVVLLDKDHYIKVMTNGLYKVTLWNSQKKPIRFKKLAETATLLMMRDLVTEIKSVGRQRNRSSFITLTKQGSDLLDQVRELTALDKELGL